MKNFFALFSALLFCTSYSMAQNNVTNNVTNNPKKNKYYKLAETVETKDYEQGKIIVKFKNGFQNLVNLPTNEGWKFSQALQKIGGTSRESLNCDKLFKDAHLQNSGRVDNSKPLTVDLTLFFDVKYDAAKMDIETAINVLYATNMIEYAEPSFIKQIFYTPNDPQIGNQYYLDNLQMYKAWDISKGDSSIVIAIVDAGVQLNHPDLKNKIKYNLADPINGIDDDKDGFIDNSRGWDFAGADFNSLQADNNPTVFGDNNTHGTAVAGCAAADTDNKIGMAGIGFNCKILPIKHAADNDTRGPGGSNQGLYGTSVGIVYAANHGASIINASYGSNDYSQVEQDVITYATIDKGCLVVAAAGNSAKREASYPASYNYVLSVGATDKADAKSSFSTYHNTVDISAPGSGIWTSHFDSDYKNTDGTSFSSPITAGAAGLVKSMYRNFTGLQVGELLRATADDVVGVRGSIKKEEMGRGRLNVQRALTEKPFAVKLLKYEILNTRGNTAQAGDTATLTGDFINYLFATSPNCKVSLSSDNPAISVLKADANLGAIQTLQTINSKSTPFRIAIQNNVSKDTEVILRLDYEDNGKTDRQFFAITLNPSYYIINKNSMTTSIGSIGRIGYEDTQNQKGGVGFVYNGNPILFELGLMMGTSETKVPNTVRSIGSTYGNDFQVVNFVNEVSPSKVSEYDLQGTFNDNNAGNRKIGLTVNYKSYVWAGKPNDKFFIVEYTVKNTTAQAINDFNIGMFADWDISDSGAEDKANWDNTNNLGYIYHTASSGLYGGIQLLSKNYKPNYYAINNDDDTNVGVYTSNTDKGFTDKEKYKTMSNGLDKITAGDLTPKGNDVSHVVAAGGITIAANDSVKIAFAFLGGDNLKDLQASASAANSLYNSTLQAKTPTVISQNVCYNSATTLTASGATKFNWYNSISGGKLIATGNTYKTSLLTADTAVFVSNAEQPFESVRTRATVTVAANPQIRLNGSAQICQNERITLTAGRGNSYLWSNGATSQSITVGTAGTYSVTVRSTNPVCEAVSSPITVSVSPIEAKFTSSFSTIDFKDNQEISFTDQSTNAVSWLWEFGNGATSREQNPKLKFATFGNYNVKLTVTSLAGCNAITSKAIEITGLEDEIFASQIKLFPNPTENQFTVSLANQTIGKVKMQIFNVLGSLVAEETIEKDANILTKTFNIAHLAAGIYTMQLQDGKAMAVKKLVITK